jgi:hypothetical protein
MQCWLETHTLNTGLAAEKVTIAELHPLSIVTQNEPFNDSPDAVSSTYADYDPTVGNSNGEILIM